MNRPAPAGAASAVAGMVWSAAGSSQTFLLGAAVAAVAVGMAVFVPLRPGVELA